MLPVWCREYESISAEAAPGNESPLQIKAQTENEKREVLVCSRLIEANVPQRSEA